MSKDLEPRFGDHGKTRLESLEQLDRDDLLIEMKKGLVHRFARYEDGGWLLYQESTGKVVTHGNVDVEEVAAIWRAGEVVLPKHGGLEACRGRLSGFKDAVCRSWADAELDAALLWCGIDEPRLRYNRSRTWGIFYRDPNKPGPERPKAEKFDRDVLTIAVHELRNVVVPIVMRARRHSGTMVETEKLLEMVVAGMQRLSDLSDLIAKHLDKSEAVNEGAAQEIGNLRLYIESVRSLVRCPAEADLTKHLEALMKATCFTEDEIREAYSQVRNIPATISDHAIRAKGQLLDALAHGKPRVLREGEPLVLAVHDEIEVMVPKEEERHTYSAETCPPCSREKGHDKGCRFNPDNANGAADQGWG